MINTLTKTQRLLVLFFFSMLLFFVGQSVSAATYYWVGNSDNSGLTSSNSNWNTTAAACGTTGNKSAAFTTADILYFTSTCTSNATINANLAVSTITIQAGYTGTITQSSGVTITNTGPFSQAAGTFVGGNSNISFTTFTLTGGVFTSTSAELTLSNGNLGSFSRTAGVSTFNNNGGTVKFAGGHTTISASGETFYGLTIAVGVNGNVTVTGTMTVNGTLLMTSGKVYTGTINAYGPVTFAYNNATSFGTGYINVVGTTTQSVIFGGGNGFIPYLTINNSQANIYYNGTTTFSHLTLTSFNGDFNTGDYPMTIYPAASYIFTLAGGNLVQGSKSFDAQYIVINGGTFNGGTGPINISTSLVINSGTFIATAGTTTLSGNGTYFHHLGGTFNANNGEFRFTGFSQSCRCSGTIFNDLTLYQSSVSTSMVVYGPTGSTPATSTVAGDFVLTRGSISAGVIDITGPTATFASGSSNAAYTGTVRFSGSDVQTVTIAGGGTSYYPKMVINNPLAEISYNGVSNINSLSIQNGTFSLGGNNITVPSGLTVGPNGNFKRYGSETITTSVPSFSVGATATYNGPAASYNLPTYAHTNANVVIDAPSSDTVYNLVAHSTTTNLTIASGVLNNGGAYALVTTNTLTVDASGSWTATSTGPITIGTGGVSNEGFISLISPSSILIRSTVSGSQRPWVGSGFFGMTGLNVKDQGGTAPIIVYSGVNSGNNDVNWTFSGLAGSPDRIWRGQTSINWSTASNWVEGSVPASTSNAIFSPAYKNPATFDAGATDPGSIIINSGYTSTVTLAKNMSISAFTQGAGTFNASSYNLTTSGNHIQTAGTFNGGSGVIDIGGNLTVSGGTFVPSSATTSVYGNFNSTGGTISATSGTMVFDGASQTITGTTTFNNINKVVSSAANLIFGAGQTFTVLGTTTLQGVSGQQLTIKSSSTPSQWLFDPRGGLDLAYVTVKDSNNISSSTTGLYPTISANDFVGITDGTNNTNWTFTLPVITVSATGTQATSTALPVTSKYMGGVFEMVSNVGTNSITSISLTQSGSLSTSQISSVSLYYKESVAGVCSSSHVFPSGTTLFGTRSVWSENKITLTGNMSVGINPTCVYVLFNLSGSVSFSNLFFGVDLQIIDPSQDIISTQASVLPATTVDITGVTTVIGGPSGYPTITFSAASSTVSTLTGSTTLTWSTGYEPHTCTASGDNGTGGEWVSGTEVNSVSGSARTGLLSSHRTYVFTITCTNSIGSTNASVSVIAISPYAPILTFSASPTSVSSGSTSWLTWSLGGDPINTPSACSASGSWSGSKNIAGGTEETTALTSSKSYTLACGNSYGTTTRSVGVTVAGEEAPQDTCVDGYWVLARTPCTGGSGTLGGSIGDSFSLTMEDSDIDPTTFYFWNSGSNNSLYMRQGPDGPNQIVKKLTADGLNITSGNFTGINCVSGSTKCRGIKIHIDLEKRGVDGSLQNYTIQKTFKTTVNTRTNND